MHARRRRSVSLSWTVSPLLSRDSVAHSCESESQRQAGERTHDGVTPNEGREQATDHGTDCAVGIETPERYMPEEEEAEARREHGPAEGAEAGPEQHAGGDRTEDGRTWREDDQR